MHTRNVLTIVFFITNFCLLSYAMEENNQLSNLPTNQNQITMTMSQLHELFQQYAQGSNSPMVTSYPLVQIPLNVETVGILFQDNENDLEEKVNAKLSNVLKKLIIVSDVTRTQRTGRLTQSRGYSCDITSLADAMLEIRKIDEAKAKADQSNAEKIKQETLNALPFAQRHYRPFIAITGILGFFAYPWIVFAAKKSFNLTSAYLLHKLSSAKAE